MKIQVEWRMNFCKMRGLNSSSYFPACLEWIKILNHHIKLRDYNKDWQELVTGPVDQLLNQRDPKVIKVQNWKFPVTSLKDDSLILKHQKQKITHFGSLGIRTSIFIRRNMQIFIHFNCGCKKEEKERIYYRRSLKELL